MSGPRPRRIRRDLRVGAGLSPGNAPILLRQHPDPPGLLPPAESGALLHEIAIGEAVQGAVFVNERHLAVTPRSGNLLVFTIDTDELVQIVRASLTRDD